MKQIPLVCIIHVAGVLELTLDAITDSQTLTNYISNIVFRGEKTNIKGGLETVATALTEAVGNRLSVRDVVIVVTDGEEHNEDDFGALSDSDLTALKNGGVEVFAVLHSAFIDTDQSAEDDWEKAVTSSDHLLVIEDYTDQTYYDFAQIIKAQMDDTCEETAVGAGVAATVDTSKSYDTCDTSKSYGTCDTSKSYDTCDTSKSYDTCDTSKSYDTCDTSKSYIILVTLVSLMILVTLVSLAHSYCSKCYAQFEHILIRL